MNSKIKNPQYIYTYHCQAITNRNSQTKNRPEEDENVQKLKVNLNYAMELAAHEAVVSSRAKEQSMRSTQTKIYVEKKYNTMSTQLYEEKDKLMKAQSKIVSLQYEFDK